MCPVHKLLPHHQPWPDRTNLAPAISLVSSLSRRTIKGFWCAETKASRHEAKQRTAGGACRRVYRREHCSHCGTACVCTAPRENEVCHCHPSMPLPRQQSHVLVYSAISTFGAMLRSVITHLWQRSGEPMRNEWNQGRHRPAPTGMDGSAKWNKLLEMQPRQAITAAPHTVLLKAGPRMHASPTSRVLSTIITGHAYYSCVWWASMLAMYICTGACLQMGCFVPRSASFLFNV